MSSNKENNGEIIKDIELEMKSNHNTNSDFISIGEISKKEIAIENASSDPYTEVTLNKKENNIEENKELRVNFSMEEHLALDINTNDMFGDLTSIIKDKIKMKATRNAKGNNKNKKIRLSTASAEISTKEKNKRLNNRNNRLNLSSTSIFSTKKKPISTSSVPKIYRSKILKKPKKNPELFVNKNTSANKSAINGALTSKKKDRKKINFNDVLKRFDEEKNAAKKKFDNKKKELKDQENKICTGKPTFISRKKNDKKYNKFTKDFLTRQKEMSETYQKNKKKLIEEDKIKKEKEFKNIKKDSILAKKMKKYRKNKSSDEWVDRLAKEDPKKRKMERDFMENISLPTFKPLVPKRLNKSVDKINKIGEVLDKYSKKKNPQLLIDYFSKNNQKFEDSDKLFRQKLFNKFVNKSKKRSNSVDINQSEENSENNEEENIEEDE